MIGSADMCVQLKGVHRVQKRLAGGRIRTYYVAFARIIMRGAAARASKVTPVRPSLSSAISRHIRSGDAQLRRLSRDSSLSMRAAVSSSGSAPVPSASTADIL